MQELTCGVIKSLSNPQNYYDGISFGLAKMPTKPVAVAAAALTSYVATCVIQPETLLTQIGTVIISSGCAWVATETAHLIASKQWNKRCAEVQAQTDESVKMDSESEGEIKNFLDQLLSANPELLKQGQQS